MKYLFEYMDSIKEDLCNKYIMLFLDYDGTLTPIVKTPDEAVIPPKAKGLLQALVKARGCKVAVISGRALADVKKMVGVKGIIYSGNHGLEIEGPKIRFGNQVSSWMRSTINDVRKTLGQRLSGIKGVIIEDKKMTVSIHYRLAKPSEALLVKKTVDEIALPYAKRKLIKVNHGKKVIEIKPPVKWDKGKIALWLLSRHQFEVGDEKIFPVYVGDDLTDEDAFSVLKNKGLTVFVGKPRASKAGFYLKDTKEVGMFLKHILKSRAG